MGKEQKNFKFYFILLSIFSVFMLFLTVFGDPGIIELRKLIRKHEGILTNVAAIRNENSKLLHEVDKLKTSKHYIEKLARKEFGMVKDGEIVFLFQD